MRSDPPRRILLVGDHAAVRREVALVLKEEAVGKCREAADRKDALAAADVWLRRFPPAHKEQPSVNSAKAGSVIPVKWQLFDSSGALISDPSSFISLTSAPVGCDEVAADIEGAAIASPGDSGLTFDGTQFQYNWLTDPTTGCRVLKLSTADGRRYLAKFNLR